MKKSPFVLLTIVASLSLAGCAVQNVPQQSNTPDPMYADVDRRNDTSAYVMPMAPVQYDYYYRSYFFDDMYRWFFPRRYYMVIGNPNFEPRHKRPVRATSVAVHHSRSLPASSRRGGFGRTGSVHSVVS